MSTVFHSQVRGIATLLASLALLACTAPGPMGGHAGHHGGHHAGHHGGQGAPAGMMGGPPGAATASGAPPAQAQPGPMDMGAMCALHRDMQKMPPEQQRAMMEERMKGMTPEMRQHHMDMMRQHCHQ